VGLSPFTEGVMGGPDNTPPPPEKPLQLCNS
jgi:hypothetical protein